MAGVRRKPERDLGRRLEHEETTQRAAPMPSLGFRHPTTLSLMTPIPLISRGGAMTQVEALEV